MEAGMNSGTFLATKLLEKLGAYYLRENVEEVVINRPGEVWVKMRRGDWEPEDAPEITYDYIKKICKVLANITNARFSESDMPIVSCQVPGKPFRFQAMIGSNVTYEMGDNRGAGMAIRALTADDRITWKDYGLGEDAPAQLPGSAFFTDFSIEADHIRNIQYVIDRHLSIIVAGATSTGKAQPVDEPVLTPEGWRRIGDLRRGDSVCAPDGTTAKIVGVYPQGRKKVSSVAFHDGRRAVCCDDHLWKAWTLVDAKDAEGKRKQAWDWRVRDTKSLKRSVSSGSKHATRTAVPLMATNAFDPPDADLPIHSYVLGVILGAGRIPSGTGSVRLTCADPELLERFLSHLPDYTAELDPGSSCDHSIKQKTKRNPSPLGAALRNLGLWGKRAHEKEIPESYMSGSLDQRTHLLQGLMDTNGTVGKNGDVSFCSTSLALAEQVQRLVWSIGGSATITRKEAPSTSNGERKAGKAAHIVHVSHRDRRMLFSIQREIRKVPQMRNEARLRIQSIESAGEAECVCIAVDHPDHLYITRDFVVTHNTTFTNRLIKMLPQNERIITVEDARELTVPQRNRLHLLVPRNRGANAIDYNAIINVLMRMTPDWVVCGELSVENAAPMYALMGKGHPIITTVHAGSPDEAIGAFTNNMSLSGSTLDPEITAERLRGQIGCIIQIDRRDGRRKVVEIVFPMKDVQEKIMLLREKEKVDMANLADELGLGTKKTGGAEPDGKEGGGEG